ncbi:hypothetical protein LBMAG48_13140 [Phycisphaerae bacterium]|nr:hypothetical protein LBMAG48_13140 [Phycisphaerae bacterium]
MERKGARAVVRVAAALVVFAIGVDALVGLLQGQQALWVPWDRPGWRDAVRKCESGQRYIIDYDVSVRSGAWFTWWLATDQSGSNAGTPNVQIPERWYKSGAFADAEKRAKFSQQRYFGLPFRSWTCLIETDRALGRANVSFVGIDGGAVWPRGQTPVNYRSIRVVPYRMRPLQWAANIVVIAGSVGGCIALVRYVRRELRKGRGLCRGCGYEVQRLQVCPECGEENPHAVV